MYSCGFRFLDQLEVGGMGCGRQEEDREIGGGE